MQRLILHIGRHKTGTTSLQYTLLHNRERLAAAAAASGLGGEPEDMSHIVPFHAGEDRLCVRAAARFREEGILAVPIRPPTVPPGRSLIRFSLTASHTEEHIDRLVEAAGRVARELELDRPFAKEQG